MKPVDLISLLSKLGRHFGSTRYQLSWDFVRKQENLNPILERRRKKHTYQLEIMERFSLWHLTLMCNIVYFSDETCQRGRESGLAFFVIFNSDNEFEVQRKKKKQRRLFYVQQVTLSKIFSLSSGH